MSQTRTAEDIIAVLRINNKSGNVRAAGTYLRNTIKADADSLSDTVFGAVVYGYMLDDASTKEAEIVDAHTANHSWHIQRKFNAETIEVTLYRYTYNYTPAK